MPQFHAHQAASAGGGKFARLHLRAQTYQTIQATQPSPVDYYTSLRRRRLRESKVRNGHWAALRGPPDF